MLDSLEVEHGFDFGAAGDEAGGVTGGGGRQGWGSAIALAAQGVEAAGGAEVVGHLPDQRGDFRVEVEQCQAKQAGRCVGLRAQPLLPGLGVTQCGVEGVGRFHQQAGLTGLARVVVDGFGVGGQLIEPGDQVGFTALDMLLQLKGFAGGLAQVLLHFIKPHILAPQTSGVPFIERGAPGRLLGQCSPSGNETLVGSTHDRGARPLGQVGFKARDMVLAALYLIMGVQQHVQVVGVDLALKGVSDGLWNQCFDVEAA